MKRDIKTLVIHPHDHTTDFLNVIYADLDCTVLTRDISEFELKRLIASHDRIIMLGHGFHGGLFGHGKIVINSTHVELLRNKKLVGVWCFANLFFEPNGLLGIYTDMIISETQEAEVFGVECTQEQVEESNRQFALAVRDAIIDDSPIDIFKRIYRSYENPVIHWNQDNFYHAYETFQLENQQSKQP
jgi:hypothetical protein